jgi:hypothetical protein
MSQPPAVSDLDSDRAPFISCMGTLVSMKTLIKTPALFFFGCACSAECRTHHIHLRSNCTNPPRSRLVSHGPIRPERPPVEPQPPPPDPVGLAQVQIFLPILPSHPLCKTKNQIRTSTLWRTKRKRTARMLTSNNPAPTSPTASTDHHPNPYQPPSQ